MPDLRGIRVLVVDDDPDAREIFAAALIHAGADVQTAASARQALTILKTRVLDVVVTDMSMPGEDGLWLLNQIKKHSPEAARVPVVVVTGHRHLYGNRNMLSVGFQQYMTKPVDPWQLCGTILELPAIPAEGDSQRPIARQDHHADSRDAENWTKTLSVSSSAASSPMADGRPVDRRLLQRAWRPRARRGRGDNAGSDALAGGAAGGVGGGGSGCGRRVNMTVAEDLRHRHLRSRLPSDIPRACRGGRRSCSSPRGAWEPSRTSASST
jgi:CheY-like chemotaxis protein